MPPPRGAGFRGAKDIDQGPPEEVVEVSSFVHACEGDVVTKLTNEKIPYFNAPIYLQNKTQIGKVDEIFGPINQSFFSVKMSEGILASSYVAGDKFYIDPAKLSPLDQLLFDNRSVVPSSRISSTRKKKRKLNHKKINSRYDSAVDNDNSQTHSYIMSPSKEKVEPETETVCNSDLTIEHEVTQVQSRDDSIELRYEHVKKLVAGKLDSAQQAVAAVSAKWKEIFRKRRNAAGELNLASVKYKEMEKELEEAVESEDFETAERVSDGLVSAEKNKEVLLIALREAETEFDAIDSKMQEALELQIVAAEECAELLNSFAVDADQNADSVITNAKTKTSEELEKWDSLSDALEVKKLEAEIESYVISGARKGLEDSIDQIVKEDKHKSQLLHEQQTILVGELRELLALAKQKEAMISENKSQIEEVEKKMAGAVSSFKDALSDLDLKSRNIQSGLVELELENDDLFGKKKEIDDFALREEAKWLKIRELARVSADEASGHREVINMRKSVIKFILKSREDKIRLAKTEQKLFDDVQMLKQDISAVRASLQDLSSTKSGTQQSIESSKQRLLFIEKRVPEIESEKRVFATARNFKEAARIANEAKTLYAEKETLQLKIDEDTSTLKKIENEINQNMQTLQEKDENVLLMEKELETVRYQRLILAASPAKGEPGTMKIGDVEEDDILLQEAEAAAFEVKNNMQLDCKKEELDGEMLY